MKKAYSLDLYRIPAEQQASPAFRQIRRDIILKITEDLKWEFIQ